MRRTNAGAARTLVVPGIDGAGSVDSGRQRPAPKEFEQPQSPLSRITVLPVVVSRSILESGQANGLIPTGGLVRATDPLAPQALDARALAASGADVVLVDARESRATLVYRAIVRLRNAGWRRGIVMLVHAEELAIVPVAASIGATDFVLSTASSAELELRLRRAAPRPSGPEIASPPAESTPAIQLHWQTHQVSFEGTSIALTLRELQLLRVLIERGRSVTTADDLARLAWGKLRKPGGGLAAAYVCSLRKKLAWFGGRFGIQTVRGIGYRFVV